MQAAMICNAKNGLVSSRPTAVFGAKAKQARAASSLKVMAYQVTLKTPSGDQVIECADDVYILDAAEKQELTSHTLAVLEPALPAPERSRLELLTSPTSLSWIRPDGQWICAHLRCLPNLRLHHLHPRGGGPLLSS
eukprot:jgi/Picre1/32493/NNA_007839.t1